jgi:hypothetical protein
LIVLGAEISSPKRCFQKSISLDYIHEHSTMMSEWNSELDWRRWPMGMSVSSSISGYCVVNLGTLSRKIRDKTSIISRYQPLMNIASVTWDISLPSCHGLMTVRGTGMMSTGYPRTLQWYSHLTIQLFLIIRLRWGGGNADVEFITGRSVQEKLWAFSIFPYYTWLMDRDHGAMDITWVYKDTQKHVYSVLPLKHQEILRCGDFHWHLLDF